MPIYEYICKKCKNQFEELVFNRSEEVPCPQCGSKRVERALSVFSHSSGGSFRSSAGSECGGCSSSSCSGCSHG
jgi:putative FmdB family regulatory protein